MNYCLSPDTDVGMSLIHSHNDGADGYNFSPATVSFGTFLTLRKVQRITVVKNSSLSVVRNDRQIFYYDTKRLYL